MHGVHLTSRGREAQGRSRPVKAWTPGLCVPPWLATPSGCCHGPCWEELLTPCGGSTHGVKSHEGLDAGPLPPWLSLVLLGSSPREGTTGALSQVSTAPWASLPWADFQPRPLTVTHRPCVYRGLSKSYKAP